MQTASERYDKHLAAFGKIALLNQVQWGDKGRAFFVTLKAKKTWQKIL